MAIATIRYRSKMDTLPGYAYDTQADRQIVFSRTSGASSIKADVYVLDPKNKQGALISTVAGEKITVQIPTSSEKAWKIFNKQTIEPDLIFSQMGVHDQDQIIADLFWSNGWRGFKVIEGSENEEIVGLHIYINS